MKIPLTRRIGRNMRMILRIMVITRTIRSIYEQDRKVIRMAREFAETKHKLVEQEEFSQKMRETITWLQARIEYENEVPKENAPDEPTLEENNTTKRPIL
uniref:Uncharacterized protein n=1 Tax=Cannabis sativa TaxID=3483 RepID=A0A803NRA1_CANSA